MTTTDGQVQGSAELGDPLELGQARTFGSLFTGIGGMDLGLERAGWTARWQVENHPDRVPVLERHWPDITRYGDVTTIDWSTVERVELVAGGFPCQDISSGGRKIGITGARSGLWKAMVAAIRDLRPRYVLVENVADLAVRGLDVVLGDLALLGFDAEWSTLSACALGAPHPRRRLFVVAQRPGDDEPGQGAHDALSDRRQEDWAWQPRGGGSHRRGGLRWLPEPSLDRVAHGVPHRVVGPQLSGLGNTVVPDLAEWIGTRLIERTAA